MINQKENKVVKTKGTKKVDPKAEANKSTFSSGKFKSACEKVGIIATKRQASKWNNKKGLAWKNRNVGA